MEEAVPVGVCSLEAKGQGMRNGIVAYISNAVAATLGIFVVAGVLPDKLAGAITASVGAWAIVFVAVNDRRSRRA